MAVFFMYCLVIIVWMPVYKRLAIQYKAARAENDTGTCAKLALEIWFVYLVWIWATIVPFY